MDRVVEAKEVLEQAEVEAASSHLEGHTELWDDTSPAEVGVEAASELAL